jgi:hypothetical protein
MASSIPIASTRARTLLDSRVTAAQELLAERVAALRTGEDWQRFLAFQAKLH